MKAKYNKNDINTQSLENTSIEKYNKLKKRMIKDETDKRKNSN